VSTEPDRDPVTDALLRKALQPTPQIGTDGCVDAETLAAWADGNLPADQAAEVEAHLAGCARCQAVLGAFATTDESAAAAAPASVIPFRPKSPIRWLLPLAASIAATLVLYTAVRNRTPTSPPKLQERQAKAEAPPPAWPPLTMEDVVTRSTPVPPPALAKKPVGAATKERAVSSNALRPAAAPAPAAAPVAAPTANAAAIPRTADRALAPPPPPASTIAPPAQAAAGASLAQSRAEAIKLDALSEVASKVVAEFTPRTSTTMDRLAAGAGGAAGGGGGRGGGGGAAARLAVTPAQPAMPVRWRIMGSGQVLKSTNGETWVAVPIAPPIFIVSGDAPSPSVCWLAGRSGVVMRSTDATTFSRIVFPDASDLRAINATDARQATVTTAIGDVYMTTDGGETWRKIGLQAFRPAAF
jgi:hypothetical protein